MFAGRVTVAPEQHVGQITALDSELELKGPLLPNKSILNSYKLDKTNNVSPLGPHFALQSDGSSEEEVLAFVCKI